MILITGGIRSGKTAAAEKHCKTFGNRVLYLAITIPSDPESRERAKRTRGHRPYYWDTYETNGNIDEVITKRGNDYDVILVDNLINLIFNEIASCTEENSPSTTDYRNLEYTISAKIRSLIDLCLKQKTRFIFVSSEMGLGMPMSSSQEKAFCEIAGRVNQLLAENCSDVYLLCCGIELKIK